MKKKIKGKVKLMHDQQSINMDIFQSPRGLRFKDKRPDKLSLKFDGKNMNTIDLLNLIEYLVTLHQSMQTAIR